MSQRHTRVNRTDRLDEQLLSAARSEVAPDDVRARVASSLGLVAGASLLAGSAAAGASGKAAVGAAKLGGVLGLGASSAAAVKLLSVLVGVAVLGGGAVLAKRATRVSDAGATHVDAPTQVLPEVATSPSAAPAGPHDINVPAAASSAESKVPSAPIVAARAAMPGALAAPSTVAEELAALDAAHALLRDAHPAEALRVISRYISRFPHGAMLPEAQLLEIDALRASGDAAGASRKTALFLRAHPDSPGAQRLLSDQAP